MHLLITTPSGFEKEAINELESILNGTKAKTTYFKGVLLAETRLSKKEIKKVLDENETTYISKVLPIERIAPAKIKDIKEFFSSVELDGKRFAVRCTRRGTHEFSSKDVESEIGAMLRKGRIVDLENPEMLCIIEILQDYCCLSVLSPDEIINKKIGVYRKWEKGKRPVSRAELKMREIMEKFPDAFKREYVALDIGAAPGGWTKAMSGAVKKVIAVDAAELDPNVKAIENVVHIKSRAEELELNEQVDIMTNDANLLHAQSAGISSVLAGKFLRGGGFLIHTVKLGIVPDIGLPAAKNLNEAADEVTRMLEESGVKIVEAVKLRHNTRNEITLIGRK